jgi:hypothetical protein
MKILAEKKQFVKDTIKHFDKQVLKRRQANKRKNANRRNSK